MAGKTNTIARDRGGTHEVRAFCRDGADRPAGGHGRAGAPDISERTIKVGIGLNDDHPQAAGGEEVRRAGEAEERRQDHGQAVRRRHARQRRDHDLGAAGRHARDDRARHLDPGRQRRAGAVRPDQPAVPVRQGRAGRCAARRPVRPAAAGQAAGEGAGRAGLLGERLPPGHQQPPADQHGGRLRRPEAARDPEPAVHRDLHRARRIGPADALPGGLHRAGAGRGRRAGEPAGDHPRVQVLRGAGPTR